MENQTPVTVTIRAPKAEGFNRLTIIRDEDDGVPEHKRIVAEDEESVTIELSVQ
ncbi:putative protein OS=Bosea thiooxidans OX=53254 GN=SAMN05660750_04075 PE=4 SV=1 [Bosea thiooxidans]|uniref:Uncharacterized protein n=1 Tax=Bosea thiooxidans TaxID=53254 RepID=A0A1T5GI82_9HYPH|nr:hypothetical protein [Bosea thiooxidans]SKC08086.1 hypothetical protein SAMN05660750_04075 [Bosea thiooxidans]